MLIRLERKFDHESSAFAELADNVYRAVVLLNDLFHNGQPQPRAALLG